MIINNIIIPKAIIFDYGGTLDTNARHWAHVLWDAYRAAAVPVSEAAFREAYVYAERYLAKNPVIAPEDDFAVLLQKKLDIETAYLQAQGFWQIADAARLEYVQAMARFCDDYVRCNLISSKRVLKELSARFPLTLVSNFYGKVAAVLSSYGLDGYFPRIIESAVVGVRKPDPAIYRLGVEATGFEAKDVLVVGDSFGKDIVPAKTVGCQTVWLKGEGWTEQEEDESMPDAVITDLAQLLSVVK